MSDNPKGLFDGFFRGFGNNAFLIFLILVLLVLGCGGLCGYGGYGGYPC